MSSSVIELINIKRDFYSGLRGFKVRAVDNVSFSLEKNEIVGLLGPNGCGKSTVMKMILGLLESDSGSCSVFGESPENVGIRKKIGYLPEAPYFQKFMTGLEVVKTAGILCDVNNDILADQCDKVLKLVKMDQAASRKIGTYSKGMLQRIGLAQALVHEPDLLILDEPTAGVDPTGSEEISVIIKDLKKSGKTVFLCSHLLTEVEEICDRIIIMNHGKIVKMGAVHELLRSETESQITLRTKDVAKLAKLNEFFDKNGIQACSEKKRISLQDFYTDLIK